MRVLQTVGLRGVERLVRSATVPGLAPAEGDRVPGRRDIAATKTAALLRAALAASDDAALQKLDGKFAQTREDLAVLAMTHASSTSRPSHRQ